MSTFDSPALKGRQGMLALRIQPWNSDTPQDRVIAFLPEPLSYFSISLIHIMIAHRKTIQHTYLPDTRSSQQYWDEFATSSNGATGDDTTTHSRQEPTTPTIATPARITDVLSETSLSDDKPLGHWQNNRDAQHERPDTPWARQASFSPPPMAADDDDETGIYYFEHETTIHLETSDPHEITLQAPHSPPRTELQTRYEIPSHTLSANATNVASPSSSQAGTTSGQVGVESGHPSLQFTSGESYPIIFSANGLDISKARALLRHI